ncbi:MAG: hypothetical protein C0475_07355 [Planctomyces sp.]|nr:hypothetical protein [Planctomyces sp.]MBA4039837.1 hypothetical protein [Planctomyces sp.]MBA4120235.1 hypothetical protein [Isosphaera sp.]
MAAATAWSASQAQPQGQPAGPLPRIPCTIASKADLSAQDRAAVTAHATAVGQALESRVPGRIEEARRAAMAGLRCDRVEVVYRLELSRAIEPALSISMAKSRDLDADGELLALNVLALAGAIATRETAAILQDSLKDERPAVRFAAFAGYAELLRAVAAHPTAIVRDDLAAHLSGLAEAIVAQTDPQQMEAGLVALASGTRARPASVPDLDVLSLGSLSRALRQIRDRLAQLGQPELGSAVLLRATSTAQAVIIERLGQPQIPALPEPLLRDLAALAGDALLASPDLLAAGASPGAVKDVVASAQSLIGLSARALGRSVQVKLDDQVERGADALRQAIGRELGTLGAGPFNLPPDRFVRASPG